MLAAIRKRWRSVRRPVVHSLVLVGLIPKFLVPLGYMPAAIGAGGPLMLCDSFAPLPAASASMHTGGRHGNAHGHGAHAQPAAPHAHGAQPVAAWHHGDAADNATDGADDPATGHGDHDEWKRCALGGLAALATITTDWHTALTLSGHERPDTPISVTDTRTHRVAFRSRAPPQS